MVLKCVVVADVSIVLGVAGMARFQEQGTCWHVPSSDGKCFQGNGAWLGGHPLHNSVFPEVASCCTVREHCVRS
jgi:hypothetical protein